MSARIFQSVIVQMREASPRTLGVIDSDGVIVASTDLAVMGQELGDVFPPENSEAVMRKEGRTFRALSGSGTPADYAAFAAGEDDLAKTLCLIASVALMEAKAHFEENNDRAAFIKSILMDNILPGDLRIRTKDLHFNAEVPRACLLIRQLGSPDSALNNALRELFPNKQTDFLVMMNPSDTAAVIELESAGDTEVQAVAETIEKYLAEHSEFRFVIGAGTPARSLRELAEKYKECQVAIEVGKVFDTERSIIYYENLGLGRLVYQLPTKLCEMFLSEIFKKNPIETLDHETLYTINKFFENNLNVSETSRRLFVHRNTLVYRLEKIKKLTGLDLREFDHAIVFKVALMVKKYLTSQETRLE